MGIVASMLAVGRIFATLGNIAQANLLCIMNWPSIF
jgi:hypothetical protein